MKGQEKIDYHNYDQINLTVKRQNADEVILSYGAFLWEKIEEKEDKYECNVVNGAYNFKFVVSRKLKKHTTDRYKFSEIETGLLK